MIKHASGSSCFKESQKKIALWKKAGPHSKPENFESEKHNTVCSFIPHDLAL